MLSTKASLLARASARPLRAIALVRAAPLSSAASSTPASDDAKGLSKEEEQRQRAQMIAEVMREKTMREVSKAAATRRPEGVSHMLDTDKKAGKDDDAPQYAAKYDDDDDEWGGPKGDEPTRYGDWERQGKAIDF